MKEEKAHHFCADAKGRKSAHENDSMVVLLVDTG